MRCLVRGVLTGLGLLVLGAQVSGCALTELRNTNRRLKEANDRLVSQNNRLEQELVQYAHELEAKNSELARLQALLEDSQQRQIVAPARENPFDEYNIPSGESREGTWVRLDSAVLFPLGQAKLSSAGRRVLNQVVDVLRREYPDRVIRVEGHTDDRPIKKLKDKYPTNWELSTARACAVVRYLESLGLSSDRLYPAGYSYHKPKAPGKSEASRRQNRRVELLILNQNSI